VSALSISRPDTRRAALSGLIDYAGLFPPASLDMTAAVAEYRQARASESGWVVNRFICPVARLEELVGAMTATMRAGEEPWRISVTVGAGSSLAREAGAVQSFTATVGNAASVDLMEVRPLDGGQDAIRAVLRAFEAVVAFEVPWDGDIAAGFGDLAGVRAEVGRSVIAKIRCGGLEPEDFPPPDAVARFLMQAADRSLPVKATAGLHHPFRHTDEETGFTHHGFVNLLVAGAMAHAGAAIGTVTAALSETDPAAFALERSGIWWREHRVGYDAATAMRSKLLLGYGSCSFEEPVRELGQLGVLPVEVTA